MESALNETIELDLEESNDLTFKIRMEGAASAPAKVRLVCENGDVSYMFNGYGTGEDEVVQFTLPKMDKKLDEGMYNARVEVLVENRYFAPLQFQIQFKKTLSVVAESIKVVQKVAKPEIKVTATPIVTPKAQPTVPSIIKFEQRPNVPQPPAMSEAAKPAVKSGSFSSLREAYEKKNSSSKDEGVMNQIARTLLRDKFRK